MAGFSASAMRAAVNTTKLRHLQSSTVVYMKSGPECLSDELPKADGELSFCQTELMKVQSVKHYPEVFSPC